MRPGDGTYKLISWFVLSDRLVTDRDTTLCHKILYIAAAQIEAMIEPDKMLNNLGQNGPYMGVLSKTLEMNSNPRYKQLLRDMKLDYWADKISEDEM